MTKNSRMILDIINSSDEHMTVEQIYLRAKEISPKVVLSTVYNNINRLAQDGAIRRISLEGCPDRYDKTVKHDHLVCRNCGRLSDVFLSDLTDTLQSQTGQDILSYNLIIHYVCPECRNKI